MELTRILAILVLSLAVAAAAELAPRAICAGRSAAGCWTKNITEVGLAYELRLEDKDHFTLNARLAGLCWKVWKGTYHEQSLRKLKRSDNAPVSSLEFPINPTTCVVHTTATSGCTCYGQLGIAKMSGYFFHPPGRPSECDLQLNFNSQALTLSPAPCVLYGSS